MISKLLTHITNDKGLYKSSRLKESYVLKMFPQEYAIIFKHSEHLINLNFSERLWLYINNLQKKPVCEVCAGPLKWMSFSQGGYLKTCSNKCKMQHVDYQNNYQATIFKKYGVLNVSQSKEVQQIIKSNNLQKYGVDSTSKLKNIKDKVANTNQIKYGGIAPINSDIIKEKIKQTNLQKYQGDIFSNQEVKDKIKQTNLLKYGVENPQQSDIIKSKVFKTFNHNQLLKYKQKYQDFDILDLNNNSLTIKGECGHEYTILASLFRQRVMYYNIKNPCIICHPISLQQSISEQELFNFIKSLNNNVIANDRTHSLEFDIYVPEQKIVIEFNGLYCHSELYKHKNYHLEKKKLAESKGLQLIHIWEDDWLFKRNIVESRLRNLLKINTTKYMARKCQLLEVGIKEAKEFFINNHLQGHVNFKKCYGLYLDGVLVSAMSFGHRRVAMGQKSQEGEYELLRFCNLLNVSVVGAANKLWQYFIKHQQPKKVITYADRSWSEIGNNVYLQMGFVYSGITAPNYFYVIDLKRKHRFNFRKDKLVALGYDSNMTEVEIMYIRGYYRIWDCGHLRFEYNE